jgi:hypothetical protein
MQLRLPKIENLLMALAAAVAFGLSFRVNQLFDDFFLYASGMSLLFLPAGVKLLFVLIGRIPAICGIMAVSVYLGYGIWPDKGIGAVIYFAFISLMTYPISAYLVMRWLGIHRDLINLRYWHIVVLSLAASVTNGVVHNVLYVYEKVTMPEVFWAQASAMTFGDFMGCFAVVGVFQLAVSHLGTHKIET